MAPSLTASTAPDDTPRIRPLTPGDLDAATRLLTATNADASVTDLLGDLVWTIERWPFIQLAAHAGPRPTGPRRGSREHPPGDRALLGVIAGRLDRDDPATGWSDDLIIDASARGLGIGAMLLAAQLDGFRRLGCRRVRGRSPESLYTALPFFQRFGFRVIERTTSQGIWGIRDGEELCVTELAL